MKLVLSILILLSSPGAALAMGSQPPQTNIGKMYCVLEVLGGGEDMSYEEVCKGPCAARLEDAHNQFENSCSWARQEHPSGHRVCYVIEQPNFSNGWNGRRAIAE